MKTNGASSSQHKDLPFAEHTSGELESFWKQDVSPLEFSALSKNLKVDVVIIGAGIAGISIAYQLAKDGKSVVVLDDGDVAGGETGRTTAHLVNVLDDRYFELEKYLGEAQSRLAAESHTAAITKIESIVNEEKIDCDFKRLDGYLFLHPSDKEETLEKEFQAAERAGIEVQWAENAPAPLKTGRCLCFPRQARFHPLKYIHSLGKAFVKMNGQIFTGTHVQAFDKSGVKTDQGHRVQADFIVAATNVPVNDIVAIHTKQAAYRTYVVAARVPKGSVSDALFWDTGDHQKNPPPYHYVRLQQLDHDWDLLIVGGEDHKTGQEPDPESHFTALREWVKIHFPIARDFTHRWSGQVMEPIDCLAFIGRNPGDEKNVFIVTGDSGNGMTHGAIGGILIPDLIMERTNPWEQLYDPSRKTLRAAGEFLRENLNVAGQYIDWVSSGDIEGYDQLASGQGGVLSAGLNKFALYKDDGGHIHCFSAACPHLGCVVQWNDAEKTFDCPCHGSRFTPQGEVVNGPSLVNLKNVELRKIDR